MMSTVQNLWDKWPPQLVDIVIYLIHVLKLNKGNELWRTWVGLTLFWLFHCQAHSAGADEKPAVLAQQQDKVVAQSRSLSTQPRSPTRCRSL